MGDTAPTHTQLSIAAAPEVSVRNTFIHVTEAPPPLARTQSMPAGTVAVPADGIDVYQPTTGEEEDVLPFRCETLDRYEMPGDLGSLVTIDRSEWPIRGRKLYSKDMSITSPPIKLGDETFRLMIKPIGTSGGRGGASFQASDGRGVVHVKCEGEARVENAGTGSLVLSVTARRSTADARGRAAADPETWQTFFKPRSGASDGFWTGHQGKEWDFRRLVDEASGTFVVCLELSSA